MARPSNLPPIPGRLPPLTFSDGIHAGGAHHTGFSLAIGLEHLEDFASMAGIECLVIDEQTNLRRFRDEIRRNDAAYR